MSLNRMFFCAFTAHILLLSGCAGLLLPEPTPVRPEAQSATQDNRAQETPQSASAAQAAERSPEMIFQALAAADRPYQRGGQSHASGFDCSGLVAHVYRAAFGLTLPHNTRAQSKLGQSIAREALLPGDLVFYNTQGQTFSHVGIYLGEDKFIHAPKPGSAVRVESMRGTYWTRRYDGARRIASI